MIGGGLDVSGGVSRGNPVKGSKAVVTSFNNLYRWDAEGWPLDGTAGWSLYGGTYPPIGGQKFSGTANNWCQINSQQDRIEGFDWGIYAAAGRRPSGKVGMVKNCVARLFVSGIIQDHRSAAAPCGPDGRGSGTGEPPPWGWQRPEIPGDQLDSLASGAVGNVFENSGFTDDSGGVGALPTASAGSNNTMSLETTG